MIPVSFFPFDIFFLKFLFFSLSVMQIIICTNFKTFSFYLNPDWKIWASLFERSHKCPLARQNLWGRGEFKDQRSYPDPKLVDNKDHEFGSGAASTGTVPVVILYF
jgi:hypothetical protein